MTKTDILTIAKVALFFKDAEKTYVWFTEPNPRFGMAQPLRLMQNGRSKKLLQIVTDLLEGNIA